MREISKEFGCPLDVAEKAVRIFEKYSSESDVFDVGRHRNDFFRRTINTLLHSEADEIPHMTRKKMFPRNGD